MIQNRWINEEEVEGEPAEGLNVHKNLTYYEHHFKCSRCDLRTHYKCGCGIALCNAGVSSRKPKGPCFAEHLIEVYE